MNKIDKIIDSIMELSVADLVVLTDSLVEKLGVDLSAMAAPAAAAVTSVTEAVEEDEEASYKIDIKGYTCDKPTAMKALRALLGTSLIETKGIIDALPYSISDKPYTKVEAEEVAKTLTAQGFETAVSKA